MLNCHAQTTLKMYYYRQRKGSITSQKSLKRYKDSIEALWNKNLFYLDHGLEKLSYKAITSYYGFIIHAYLDISADSNTTSIDYLKTLLNVYRKNFSIKSMRFLSSKEKILYSLFYFSPVIYCRYKRIKNILLNKER